MMNNRRKWWSERLTDCSDDDDDGTMKMIDRYVCVHVEWNGMMRYDMQIRIELTK
jgi:hypothetical protein